MTYITKIINTLGLTVEYDITTLNIVTLIIMTCIILMPGIMIFSIMTLIKGLTL